MARKFLRLSFLLLWAPYILARGSRSSSTAPTNSTPSAPSTTAPNLSGTSVPSNSNPSSPVTNSSSTSSVSIQSGPLTIPISTYPFTPFPTPTLLPEPPVFPETDPLYPPPVSPDPVIVPDFAPAWATAYSKAQALVRVNSFAPDFLPILPFFLRCRFPTIQSSKRLILPLALAGQTVFV
jgi:cytoskeletal protein RodZ